MRLLSVIIRHDHTVPREFKIQNATDHMFLSRATDHSREEGKRGIKYERVKNKQHYRFQSHFRLVNPVSEESSLPTVHVCLYYCNRCKIDDNSLLERPRVTS